ncbi:MAG TPA: glycosyltransferase [Rubrobacteraceae bacterium]|nr:glycosyltransferase [Rubrobacteraceae bacterium]
MDRPPVIILAGVRWDFLWQRHQTLATLFARAGYPTTFVETTGLATPKPAPATLRKLLARARRSSGSKIPSSEANLAVYSPLTLPPTLKIFRRLNTRFFVPRVVEDLRKSTGPEPVIIAYPPTRTTLDLISGLRPRLVLYDCSDDYAAFPGVPKDIAATEHELLRRSDLVSCTSTHLLEKVRPERPDAFLSGPGVDYERFATVPSRRADIRTVCFFGHLGEERIDFAVLRTIARAGFEVRIIGGMGRVERGFLKLPGIDYRGEVSHADLPSAFADVDAFVLPYRMNALTKGISPAKTYECLATGRPVVAAPLPAMMELADYVYLAERPEDYVKALWEIAASENEERRRARQQLARENSWELRFADLEEKILCAL